MISDQYQLRLDLCRPRIPSADEGGVIAAHYFAATIGDWRRAQIIADALHGVRSIAEVRPMPRLGRPTKMCDTARHIIKALFDEVEQKSIP